LVVFPPEATLVLFLNCLLMWSTPVHEGGDWRLAQWQSVHLSTERSDVRSTTTEWLTVALLQ